MSPGTMHPPGKDLSYAHFFQQNKNAIGQLDRWRILLVQLTVKVQFTN